MKTRARKCNPRVGGGGTRKHFNWGARVIFGRLKFDRLLFFGVAQNEGCFKGVEK